MNRLAAAVLMAGSLVGCEAGEPAPPVEHRYGPDPRHVLDVYAPRQPARGAVVLFHGGGWQGGSKEGVAALAAALAGRGYAVAAPNYRLHPAARYPDFIVDAAAATAWMRQHAGTRPVLAGYSAGAYLAAMLVFDERWLAAVGLDACRDIAGAVGIAGPYDAITLPADEQNAIFGPMEIRPERLPFNYVDGTEAPFLAITGSRDGTVEPGHAERLVGRIAERGGRGALATYPLLGHNTIVRAAPFVPVIWRIADFVADVSAPTAAACGTAGKAAG